MVEPEAHDVRLGAGQVLVVVEGEQAEPGVEVRGEVAGEHPAFVHGPGLRREVVQAHRLVRTDVVFDHRVMPVQCVDPLGLM
ncbi:hypothetical protein ACWEQ1_27275 [Streptomyces nodosus]